MKSRKILSVTLAAAITCSLSCVSVFAAETQEQSADVIGTVEEKVSEPDYSVEIPEAIDLGTIATDADTTQSYDVKVIATELSGGSVSVTGEDAGTIANGESTIAFSNSFGTQTVSEETDESGIALSGEITVAAEDAADAAAGDYSGTTVFTIGYNAAGAETPDVYSCTNFDVVSASSGGSYVSFFESLTAYKQADGSYNLVLYLPASDVAVWDVTEKYPKDNVTATIDDNGNETLVFSGITTYEEDGYPFGFRYQVPAMNMDHDFEMLLTITESDAAALGLTGAGETEAVVAKYEAAFACEGVYSESYGGYTTLLNAVGSMIANYMVSPVTVTQYSNGSCDIAIECTSDKVFYLQVLEQVEDANSWQVGADGLYIGSEADGMYNEVSDKNEQDDGVFTVTLSELPEKLYMETNVGGAMEGTFDYIVCSMTLGDVVTD